MSNAITLTASMRSNLTALRTISSQMERTQERLSSGKKVNSAIDNASSFYQARSLTNRASDLNALLDSMGQGIQTIQAANEGLEAASAFLDQMQSVASQAIAGIAPYHETLIMHDFWDGASNTQKIVAKLDEIGVENYPAKACLEYSVTEDDLGKWYLPSLGELMDVYGYDYGKITSSAGTSGAAPAEGKTKINAALTAIGTAKASTLTENWSYWSSSEKHGSDSWYLGMTNGARTCNSKGNNFYVRAFQLLENKFDTTSGNKIAVGDIVYSDFSYTDAEHYDNSKDAVGVVTWVSDSGASAKIMSLKDVARMTWGGFGTDIPDLKNYSNETEMLNIFHGIDDGSITRAEAFVDSAASLTPYVEQFNTIRTEYDKLIADSSYQGINLLNGGTLNITFNESRTNNYEVQGYNATADGLNISAASWQTASDINDSVAALDSAIKTLRSYAETLGNSYSIIETRQQFTDRLVNVLETGADELTLADMNEESANYLALQTRQQLAVNSLSLASQSAQSVLKLF